MGMVLCGVLGASAVHAESIELVFDVSVNAETLVSGVGAAQTIDAMNLPPEHFLVTVAFDQNLAARTMTAPFVSAVGMAWTDPVATMSASPDSAALASNFSIQTAPVTTVELTAWVNDVGRPALAQPVAVSLDVAAERLGQAVDGQQVVTQHYARALSLSNVWGSATPTELQSWSLAQMTSFLQAQIGVSSATWIERYETSSSIQGQLVSYDAQQFGGTATLLSVSTVPEPDMALMWGIGLTAMVWAWRRALPRTAIKS